MACALASLRERFMPRSEFLIPLAAEIGNVVTRAVRSFAEHKALEAEFWIQDLPLWSLSEQDERAGIIRRLQIGAYRLDESDELRVIPQVFRLNKERHSLTALDQIDPKLIRWKRLGDLKEPEDVTSMLDQGWQDVLKMPLPEQSKGISIPLSPHFRW